MCRVKEAFLETIFYGIGQFLYDPVKEIIVCVNIKSSIYQFMLKTVKLRYTIIDSIKLLLYWIL